MTFRYNIGTRVRLACNFPGGAPPRDGVVLALAATSQWPIAPVRWDDDGSVDWILADNLEPLP